MINCLLLSLGNYTARPVIPRRGEKDFEPADGGGSGLQRHNLERARSAMFDVLRSTRAISRCDCLLFAALILLKLTPPPLYLSTCVQQVCQLCSLVPRSCPCACDSRERCPFHFYGPLGPASVIVGLRKTPEKAGAFA